MRGVIKNFQERLDEIRDDSKTLARGMRCLEAPHWFFSRSSNGNKKPGKFDFEGVYNLFDRIEAETNYMQAIESGGSKQELAIASNQSDILSGMERDYLARHRSRIRMLAHEATARRHNGSDRGVIQSALMMYFENQLQRVSGNNAGSNNG